MLLASSTRRWGFNSPVCQMNKNNMEQQMQMVIDFKDNRLHVKFVFPESIESILNEIN